MRSLKRTEGVKTTEWMITWNLQNVFYEHNCAHAHIQRTLVKIRCYFLVSTSPKYRIFYFRCSARLNLHICVDCIFRPKKILFSSLLFCLLLSINLHRDFSFRSVFDTCKLVHAKLLLWSIAKYLSVLVVSFYFLGSLHRLFHTCSICDALVFLIDLKGWRVYFFDVDMFSIQCHKREKEMEKNIRALFDRVNEILIQVVAYSFNQTIIKLSISSHFRLIVIRHSPNRNWKLMIRLFLFIFFVVVVYLFASLFWAPTFSIRKS